MAMPNVQELDAIIEKSRERFVRDTSALVAVPSVKAAPEPGAPFGPAVRRALDEALRMCEGYGLTTRCFDGYAGDATVGPEGTQVMGILAHLDVVPAGDGWKATQPFVPLLQDGRLYGRGAGDDKGPAVAALIALRSVLDAGYTLKNRVRIVLGCDEESGWGCMEHYKAATPMPDFGFSPDGGFPVCFAEKGILHARVHIPWDEPDIVSIKGGERPNVVPAAASARLRGFDAAFASCRELPGGTSVKAEQDDMGVTLSAEGKGSHGSAPGLGCNAATALLLALGRTLPGQAGTICRVFGAAAASCDGAGFGISCADEPSGPLTCNLGVVEGDSRGLCMSLDIRYPVTKPRQLLMAALEGIAAAFEGTASDAGGHEPLYLPKDDPMILSLLSTYREVMGGDPEPYAMGGGTYARAMARCVAFGPVFPGRRGGDTGGAHQADEYVNVDEMLSAAKIYARAIVSLCT